MQFLFSIRGSVWFLSRLMIILSIFAVTACGDDDDDNNQASVSSKTVNDQDVNSETQGGDVGNGGDEVESESETSYGPVPYPQAAQEKVYSFVTVQGRNLYWDKKKAERAIDIIKPDTREKIKLKLLKVELPKPGKRRLEANGVRVVVPWSELQPSEGGELDSGKTGFYRDLISKIIASGMEPMVSFGRAPKWLDAESLTNEELESRLYEYLSGVTQQVFDINTNIRQIQLWDEDKAGGDFGNLTTAALVIVGNYVRETMPEARTYLSVNADSKKWLDNTRTMFESDLQLANVVDAVGISYYPGAKNLIRGLGFWKPLEQLAQEINDSGSPLFGKMGAVMETGYSTYGPAHGQFGQSFWIGTSLAKMASTIKKATGYEHKIVAWNWNQFSDTPWLGRLKTGLLDSNYGITSNNVGLYTKKAGFGSLRRKISKVSSIHLQPAPAQDINLQGFITGNFGPDLKNPGSSYGIDYPELLPLLANNEAAALTRAEPVPTPEPALSDGLLKILDGGLVLEPVTSDATEIALIIVQGAGIKQEQYRPLAEAIQKSTTQKLWVGVPNIPFNMPQPLTLYTDIKRLIKKMKSEGMNAEKIYLAGHSLGGVMAQEVYKLHPEFDGVIFLGSFITRSNRSHFENTPTLTVGAEVDGLTRIARIAESFYHQIQTDPDRESASVQHPVVMVPGMNHMQFASGKAPLIVKLRDLAADISFEDAHEKVAQLIADFLAAQVSGETAASDAMISHVDEAEELLSPLIRAMVLEGSLQFKESCYERGADQDNCWKGSPWTIQSQILLSQIPEERFTIHDEFHKVWKLFPYYHPEIYSTCDAGDDTCKVEMRTVSQPFYQILDTFDTGFVPVSANEIRAKFKSRQSILGAFGQDGLDFEETDGGSQCMKLNQKALDWAAENASDEALARYTANGVPMVVGEDLGPYSNGPQWIWTPLSEKYKTDEEGNKVRLVRSATMKTALGKGLKQHQGFHYCKLLSPARALEWIYTDGLRSSITTDPILPGQ